MPFAPKVILHCPTGYRIEIDDLVKQFLVDGVKFVGIVGKDCERIEDIIDELVVGDGSGPDRFLLTSSHPDEDVSEAVAFANSLSEEYSGAVQIVEA